MAETKESISELEQLIDELEAFAEKSPWWVPGRVAIPDEEFFRVTQRMRESMPAELGEAIKTLEKRDLIMKNAQEEHRRIIDAAERRLEDLTSQDQLVIAAREEALRIVAQARQEAESLKRDSLLYTAGLLEDMERQFSETVVALTKGRAFLEGEMRGQSHAAPAEATPATVTAPEPGA